jgi:peptide/nickel transport system ATP-binding protein/oligopeptide transport system ATP-binding protein
MPLIPGCEEKLSDKLLEISNLKTYFYTAEGVIPAVNGVDLEVGESQTLGLVGESACGKSVTALSIVRLVPSPPGKIVEGKINFEGKNLLDLEEREMRRIRGAKISMIFQDPLVSLNPLYTIGNQIEEAIILHQKLKKKKAREKALEMLNLVGIPSPRERLSSYPHQLSGGMCQRAMIAMALSSNPSLLIADEPTTALDVTIQAQILELLQKLKEEIGMSIILITHDLGIIAKVANAVAVMYAGKIVEYAKVGEIFKKPGHPYTQGLLNSIPQLTEKKERLKVIEGNVPNPLDLPSGCKFHPRCPLSDEKCRKEEPLLEKKEDNHRVRCWKC